MFWNTATHSFAYFLTVVIVNKVYWNTDSSIPLYTVYGCCISALTNCNRNWPTKSEVFAT